MSDATTSCNIGGQTSTIPQNRIIERKMPVSKRSSRRKRHTGTVECVKKPGLRGMKMKIWRQKRSVKLPLFWVNHKFASPQVRKSPSSQVPKFPSPQELLCEWPDYESLQTHFYQKRPACFYRCILCRCLCFRQANSFRPYRKYPPTAERQS